MKKVRIQMVYEFEYDEDDLDGYLEVDDAPFTKKEMMECALDCAQNEMLNVSPEIEVSYWED